MKTFPLYRIGAVAKRTGSSVYAIRFYEKEGLVPRPSRNSGGFRMYPPSAAERILFIKKAQGFGLTLKEIKRIMRCGDQGLEPCCKLVTKLLESKIQEFETKIGDLQGMKRRLKRLLSNWTRQ